MKSRLQNKMTLLKGILFSNISFTDVGIIFIGVFPANGVFMVVLTSSRNFCTLTRFSVSLGRELRTSLIFSYSLQILGRKNSNLTLWYKRNDQKTISHDHEQLFYQKDMHDDSALVLLVCRLDIDSLHQKSCNFLTSLAIPFLHCPF